MNSCISTNISISNWTSKIVSSACCFNRYTVAEQLCENLNPVPHGITATNWKVLRILIKLQYIWLNFLYHCFQLSCAYPGFNCIYKNRLSPANRIQFFIWYYISFSFISINKRMIYWLFFKDISIPVFLISWTK